MKEIFAPIIGADYCLDRPDDKAPYERDRRDRLKGESALVLRPGSREEIVSIVQAANRRNIALIPQGGNTGLVGAGVPIGGERGGNCAIVSLERMDRILEIDPLSNTILVEAGALLHTVQQEAERADRLFPLSMGSQGSCRIGGAIGSNAGGLSVLAYGTVRELVMGLEAVLPTGETLNLLSTLRKDNRGFDLKNLFIGAEGALGIVTKAVLKLFPRPKSLETILFAMSGLDECLKLFHYMNARFGRRLTAFELMNRKAVSLSLKMQPQNFGRITESPWALLVDIASYREGEPSCFDILADAAHLTRDSLIAQSLAQQASFWQMRHNVTDAQSAYGASVKNDISLPLAAVSDFVKRADRAVKAIAPRCRIVSFGHLGDGNLHYNISQPADARAEDFLALEPLLHETINDLVARYGGSFSAEHGIGQIKRESLERHKDPVALALMRRIKRELDPKNIMNPHKTIRLDGI